MFNEMPLDQAMQRYAPQTQPMIGTKTPEQMAQGQQQQAIVDALRGMNQQQSAAPQQAGRVTSTGAFGDGMDTQAVGGALGKAAGGISDWLKGSGNFAPADLAGTSFI